MGTIADKTLDDLAWGQLLGRLADRCHTERGEEAARALPFCANAGEAAARIAEIAEARLLHQLQAPLPMGGIRTIDDLLERVEKGGDLVGIELLAVGETVAAFARIKRHLSGRRETTPRLGELAEPMQELPHVSGPILESFEEGGRLADHASPALGPLRRKLAKLHEELSRRAAGMLDDPGIAPYLQDRFYTQRDDRYVVPLRADARSRVKGIVHGTSQSGQTVFVEPDEIVELNNRLKIAEADVAEEERRILAELSRFVREDAAAIRVAVELATRLDVIDGAALLADALDAAEPELSGAPGTGELRLTQARHPLMVLAGRDCVPNDILLAPGATMILSGPNAGGKTVALKTAGMAALMTRAGLPVAAAPGSKVPFYDAVETDIGDDQSIERNLSTFSAHVLRVNEFLAAARPGALLLVDELAVGTEPEQGAALAQAVLETLAAAGAQAIVTTHYERLKALATEDPRFVNASVGFDLARMAPTFQLHLGVPGSSGALLVARRLGLPGEVVARAEAILGDRRTGVEELLTAATEERRRLETERREVERARRDADVARRDAEAVQREAKSCLDLLRKGAHDDALAALRRARDEAERLRKRLAAEAKTGAKKGGGEEVAALRDELTQLGDRIAGHAPAAPAPRGRAATEGELTVGREVFVAKLGGRGTVVAAPDRGRVIVQVGGLRTVCAIEEVRLEDRAGSKVPPPPHRGRGGSYHVATTVPTATAVPGPAGEDLAPMRTGDNSLDLRGARVDDALPDIDRFLDDSLLAGRDVVFLIHGHGTGALRAAVREHLDMHAAVSRWRPGAEKEGGDGATVVWLDV